MNSIWLVYLGCVISFVQPCFARPIHETGLGEDRDQDYSSDDERSNRHPQCQKYTEKTVHLVDSQLAIEFERAYTRDVFHKDLDTNKSLFEVNGGQEIAEVLRGLRDRCVLVRRLVFQSHGDTGYMAMLPQEDFIDLSGLDDAFAPEAYIEIRSCNVGRDIIGAQYVKALGRKLLRNGGGVISAPRGWYYTGTLMPSPSSLSGWRSYIVEPGGEGRFEDPMDLTRIADELKDELERLSSEIARHDHIFEELGLAAKYGALRQDIDQCAILLTGREFNPRDLMDGNSCVRGIAHQYYDGFKPKIEAHILGR